MTSINMVEVCGTLPSEFQMLTLVFANRNMCCSIKISFQEETSLCMDRTYVPKCLQPVIPDTRIGQASTWTYYWHSTGMYRALIVVYSTIW